MLIRRGILNTVFLFFFLVLLLAPARPVLAAAVVVAPAGPPTIAPAVAPEDAGAAQSWKLRLDFKEINLQLVGVATLLDQSSCFIKTPGSSEQMIYTVGDVIGGFRIAAIDPRAVTFERQGLTFPLALGQSSGAAPEDPKPMATGVDDVTMLAPPAPIVADKTADGIMKTKTNKYATARLIDDAFTPRRSSRGSSGKDSLPDRTTALNFASPLKGMLTSGYGYRRHPLGGGIRYHRGVDIAAAYGTPIHAAERGRVVAVYNSAAHDLGRHIIIKHNDEYETCYGHLSRISVSTGQMVDKGEVIGREGSSGSSTGPHLHFEVRRNKESKNPLNYISVK